MKTSVLLPLLVLVGTACAEPATDGPPPSSSSTSTSSGSPSEERPEEEKPGGGGVIPIARISWTSLKGAKISGRPEASTIERTVETGLIWGTKKRGRWGASIQIQDRADSNLNPVPGSAGRIGGFRGVGVRGFHTRDLARNRKFQAFLSLRGSAEDPGEVTDGLSGILAFGWDRKVSRTLRFGYGLVIIETPDRGLRAFPAPSLSWDPPGPLSASIGGPRAGIRYDLSDKWQLGFSAGLQLRRYQLRSGQTFVDNQLPIRLGLSRMVHRQSIFEVFVGRLLNRSWRVEGGPPPGGRPQELDVDGGTFFGFQASIPLGRRPGRSKKRQKEKTR